MLYLGVDGAGRTAEEEKRNEKRNKFVLFTRRTNIAIRRWESRPTTNDVPFAVTSRGHTEVDIGRLAGIADGHGLLASDMH